VDISINNKLLSMLIASEKVLYKIVASEKRPASGFYKSAALKWCVRVGGEN